TGLFTDGITATSAVVHWNAVSSATSYDVKYKKDTKGGAWTTVTINAPATSFTLTGLSANASYKWEIQAKCGKTKTVFSADQFFKTLASKVADEDELSLPQLSIFPNPNSGMFTVELDLSNTFDSGIGIAELQITNLFNQLILKRNVAVENGKLSWNYEGQ